MGASRRSGDLTDLNVTRNRPPQWRLNYTDDSTQSLDDYLKQFEAHATCAEMDDITKICTLIGSLKGEAALVARDFQDEDTWE